LLNNLTQNKFKIEIKVLFAVFVIVTGTLIFVLIANEVNKGETKTFDQSILKSLRSEENIHQPVGPQWIEFAMTDITSLGGGTVIVIVTVLVIGFLSLQKNYSFLWLVLGSTVGGALIALSLKELIGRERPDIIFHLVYTTSFSFPSGHSMMSAVVYLTQASLLSQIQEKRSLKIYIITAALVLTFLIGISRVYLGVHYPTDVLAGWSLGLAWASFCWFAARFITKKKKANLVKN
jgi:undecaprenyl-diphosphatase